MSAVRTSRVAGSAFELFEELINRLQSDPGDLEAFLAAHPDHAGTLRELLPAAQALVDLSRSDGASGSYPPSIQPPAEPTAGVLGDYRIIREVGRGGMGIVYEAEQISLNRRVALKILPFAATLDPKHLQRFRNESRAAASLRHEHIVHVYGVGCERGIHYYAMEFIDGLSLAQVIARLPADGSVSRERERPLGETATYASAPQAAAPAGVGGDAPTTPVAALSTELTGPRDRAFYRAAARLVADAANALEHAHSLGIIHRDVKPGNLLVDPAGKVYVADFGLARFGSDADLTMSGDLLGTLRYMSPEQALAKHGLVDHRTDVYSLGATLYELLTLRAAMDGADKQEILRKIAFEEPKAPRTLDRTIPEELETITLKALAKEPAERYAAAGDLASDLRRWLGHLTIKARPPGLRQRVVKWTRRHPGVTVTTGMSAVLVLGLVIAGLGVNNALMQQERKRTQEALKLAFQSAREMLLKIADAIGDAPGLEQTQRSVVESAVAIYEGLADHQENAPDVEQDRGLAQFRLGMLHDRLGDLKKGEEAYTQAADIFRRLVAQEPNNAEYRYGQAHSLAEHGDLCDRLGNGNDAEVLARQAYALFEKAAADFPNDMRIRVGWADCCLVLGSVNFVPGPRMNYVFVTHHAPRRWKDCINLLRQALKLYAAVIANEAGRSEYGWRYHRTQKILSQMPNLPFEEREQLAKDSVAGFEALIKEFPSKPRPRAELCETLAWRGLLSESAGRPADAESANRHALTIADKLVEDFPNVPYYRTLQATTHAMLGRILIQTDRLAEGEPFLARAAAKLEATLEGHVPTWQLWCQAGACYSLLGVAYEQAQRWDDAEKMYRRVWPLALRLARDHQNSATWSGLARTTERLAAVLRRRGATEEGIALHFAHAKFWEGQAALQPSNVLILRANGWSLNNLGVFLRTLGRWDQADRAFVDALVPQSKLEDGRLLNPGSGEYWDAVDREGWWGPQKNRGWLYAQVGRPDEAEKAVDQIVQRAFRKLDPAPDGTPAQRKEVARAMRDHGWFLNRIGRRHESIAAYEEAIRRMDQWAVAFPNELHASNAAYYRMELAFVYQLVGNPANANRVADEAVAFRRQLASSNKPMPRRDLAVQLKDQGLIQWRTGRITDAASSLGEAVEIMQSVVSDPSNATEARLRFEGVLALVTSCHAYLLEHTGQFAKAEAAYLKSVSLRRGLAKAVIPGEWVGREQAGAVNGFVSAHTDWSRSLLELAWFHLRRGESEQAADRCAESRTVLEEAVARYPGDATALNQLAWFLANCPVETLRDPARAMLLAHKTVALSEASDYVGTLGAVQYRAGDFRAAVATLDHATRLSHLPPEPSHLFLRAMARWRLSDTDAARKDYDEALRRPEWPYYGQVYRQQLREEAAALLGVK